MRFVQILFLLVIWIIPLVFLMNIYMKMTEEDQEKFRGELKRPAVFLGLGIPVIGLLLFLSGLLSSLKVLQHFGAILLLVSWIVTSLFSWKRGKSSAVESVALLLLGVVGVFGYNYLF